MRTKSKGLSKEVGKGLAKHHHVNKSLVNNTTNRLFFCEFCRCVISCWAIRKYLEQRHCKT